MVLCVLYIILITYFVGKLLMKPKSSEGLVTITSDNERKKKKKKRISSTIVIADDIDNRSDPDYEQFDSHIDPMNSPSGKESSDDDALFNRQANRSRFISGKDKPSAAGSGKNLQYNMLKDNFQIVEGAPSMAEFGA